MITLLHLSTGQESQTQLAKLTDDSPKSVTASQLHLKEAKEMMISKDHVPQILQRGQSLWKK